MAEGARLESVFTRKGNVGSNPTLSAIQSGLQRIPTIGSSKIRELSRFFAIPPLEADRGEWTGRSRAAIDPVLFSEAAISSPDSRKV